MKEFLTLVQNLDDYKIAIEFDHWTDGCHPSLLGVVATITGGQQYLICLEDVSMIGHSSSAIESTIMAGHKSMSPKKLSKTLTVRKTCGNGQ